MDICNHESFPSKVVVLCHEKKTYFYLKKRIAIDFVFVDHPNAHCIEVIAYNIGFAFEYPRLYLNSAVILQRAIDPELLQRALEEKKRVSDRELKGFDEQAVEKEVVRQLIVRNIFSRLEKSFLSGEYGELNYCLDHEREPRAFIGKATVQPKMAGHVLDGDAPSEESEREQRFKERLQRPALSVRMKSLVKHQQDPPFVVDPKAEPTTATEDPASSEVREHRPKDLFAVVVAPRKKNQVDLSTISSVSTASDSVLGSSEDARSKHSSSSSYSSRAISKSDQDLADFCAEILGSFCQWRESKKESGEVEVPRASFGSKTAVSDSTTSESSDGFDRSGSDKQEKQDQVQATDRLATAGGTSDGRSCEQSPAARLPPPLCFEDRIVVHPAPDILHRFPDRSSYLRWRWRTAVRRHIWKMRVLKTVLHMLRFTPEAARHWLQFASSTGLYGAKIYEHVTKLAEEEEEGGLAVQLLPKRRLSTPTAAAAAGSTDDMHLVENTNGAALLQLSPGEGGSRSWDDLSLMDQFEGKGIELGSEYGQDRLRIRFQLRKLKNSAQRKIQLREDAAASAAVAATAATGKDNVKRSSNTGTSYTNQIPGLRKSDHVGTPRPRRQQQQQVEGTVKTGILSPSFSVRIKPGSDANAASNRSSSRRIASNTPKMATQQEELELDVSASQSDILNETDHLADGSPQKQQQMQQARDRASNLAENGPKSGRDVPSYMRNTVRKMKPPVGVVESIRRSFGSKTGATATTTASATTGKGKRTTKAKGKQPPPSSSSSMRVRRDSDDGGSSVDGSGLVAGGREGRTAGRKDSIEGGLEGLGLSYDESSVCSAANASIASISNRKKNCSRTVSKSGKFTKNGKKLALSPVTFSSTDFGAGGRLKAENDDDDAAASAFYGDGDDTMGDFGRSGGLEGLAGISPSASLCFNDDISDCSSSNEDDGDEDEAHGASRGSRTSLRERKPGANGKRVLSPSLKRKPGNKKSGDIGTSSGAGGSGVAVGGFKSFAPNVRSTPLHVLARPKIRPAPPGTDY